MWWKDVNHLSFSSEGSIFFKSMVGGGNENNFIISQTLRIKWDLKGYLV